MNRSPCSPAWMSSVGWVRWELCWQTMGLLLRVNPSHCYVAPKDLQPRTSPTQLTSRSHHVEGLRLCPITVRDLGLAAAEREAEGDTYTWMYRTSQLCWSMPDPEGLLCCASDETAMAVLLGVQLRVMCPILLHLFPPPSLRAYFRLKTNGKRFR